MTAQEIELWVRDIIKTVQSNQKVEDFRVELKSTWPDSAKAARRLGGHANAARGESILWLMGVDEEKGTIPGVDPIELADWYNRVQSHFDGYAPDLLIDLKIEINGSTVVALYFETAQGAPFVIKNPTGGYPEFSVPWRVGTGIRAAKREYLLRLLVPIKRLSGLIGELEFNSRVAQYAYNSHDAWGCPFRDEEFYRAMYSGALDTLKPDIKELISQAYIAMGRANEMMSGALSSSVATVSRRSLYVEAQNAVKGCSVKIVGALTALKKASISSTNPST